MTTCITVRNADSIPFAPSAESGLIAITIETASQVTVVKAAIVAVGCAPTLVIMTTTAQGECSASTIPAFLNVTTTMIVPPDRAVSTATPCVSGNINHRRWILVFCFLFLEVFSARSWATLGSGSV